MTIRRTLGCGHSFGPDTVHVQQAANHSHGGRLPSNTRAVPSTRHERYKRHSRVGHIRCYDLRQGGRKGGREGERKGEGRRRGRIGIRAFASSELQPWRLLMLPRCREASQRPTRPINPGSEWQSARIPGSFYPLLADSRRCAGGVSSPLLQSPRCVTPLCNCYSCMA